ncbi:MAG: exodeoxyribonuclease III [Bacteriovoracaceae bacterium]|nr:exodeoxyribonuclease III [Bacteriovoracaceae bacterium]
MKLASWNVAGLRAAHKKGFVDWLNRELPDIVCLQEIKAMEDQLPADLTAPKGYKPFYFPAERKGYSGVALLIKDDFAFRYNITKGMSVCEYDIEGRTISIEFDNLVFIGSYFPNAGREFLRLDYKLDYSYHLLNLASDLRASGKEVIICGDVNAAHKEIDLANPKANVKNTGFTPIEREYIDDLEDYQFVDVFRHHNPDQNGHYTWWTYRSDCRARNIGWRIDYFFISKGLLDKVQKTYHQTEVMGSDHCPVILELDL